MQQELYEGKSEIKKSYRTITNQIGALEAPSEHPLWFIDTHELSVEAKISQLKLNIASLHRSLEHLKTVDSEALLDASISEIKTEVTRLYKGCLLNKRLKHLTKTLWALTRFSQDSLQEFEQELALLSLDYEKICQLYEENQPARLLFNTPQFEVGKKHLLAELKFLKNICKQAPAFCDMERSACSAKELVSQAMIEQILNLIREEKSIRVGLKVNLRIKFEKRFCADKAYEERLLVRMNEARAELYKLIQECRTQITVFLRVINNDQKVLRPPLFTNKHLDKLGLKALKLREKRDNFQLTEIEIPETDALIQKFKETKERLLATILARLKTHLSYNHFQQQKCLDLLAYYQSLAPLSKASHEKEVSLDKIRKKIFWQSYECRYMASSFWGRRCSYWLYKRKDKISWQDILSHAAGQNLGYTGNRTKQTLIALGWIERNGKLSQKGAWLQSAYQAAHEAREVKGILSLRV